MSDKDDGIKQNLLFDDSELESCAIKWTPEETKILNDTRENQINYIRDYLNELNLVTGKVTIQDVSPLVYELIHRNGLTYTQLNYLVATQEEKIQYAIKNHAMGDTVDDICSVLFCKKSIVYKWLKENKTTVLEKKIDYLENKINEYNVLNCYPSSDIYEDFLEYQLKKNNIDTSNLENIQNNELFVSQIANDLETLKGYVLEKNKGDSLYLEKQEKQFLKYKKELEQTKQELERLKQISIQETAPACTTATKTPNDIIMNDFYDFLTYHDNLELFAQRQTMNSHSLRLTPKITETKIQLKLIKTNTKSLILQMDKPKNVNMAYIRDLFVLAGQKIAKLDKEQLTPENLRLNPVKINISTIDYFENSNYKSLRKIQEMSKDEYISFLGSLAIFGKSKIYDGKGKSRKEIFASESEDIKKKYIPMFKSIGYQNNNIELVLNDVFPWESFTLQYFTMLPDNYLKLSENAKTLLMYLVSQARIKKESVFKIKYSDLQILLNLKSYEQDKIHATERIIKPIQRAYEEINEKNSYFVCIDEDIDKSRTPKEILETGFITVKVLHDIKDNIDIVNDSRTKEIEKVIKHKKKTSKK
jgi:hypothetical protein